MTAARSADASEERFFGYRKIEIPQLARAHWLVFVRSLQSGTPKRPRPNRASRTAVTTNALVRKLLPGKKAPAYVNRGARLLCALPAPFPGALPRCVSAFLPAGGSWTAGAVCAMAERERRLAGVRDFRERRDWDGDEAKENDVVGDDVAGAAILVGREDVRRRADYDGEASAVRGLQLVVERGQ